MPYDPDNVFAKILRGEIPCDKVYEDNLTLAFRDSNPQAPVHVLVIPKGAYITLEDFTAKAAPEEVAGFFQAVGLIVQQLELVEPGTPGAMAARKCRIFTSTFSGAAIWGPC